jgi:hypothetical protein
MIKTLQHKPATGATTHEEVRGCKANWAFLRSWRPRLPQDAALPGNFPWSPQCFKADQQMVRTLSGDVENWASHLQNTASFWCQNPWCLPCQSAQEALGQTGNSQSQTALGYAWWQSEDRAASHSSTKASTAQCWLVRHRRPTMADPLGKHDGSRCNMGRRSLHYRQISRIQVLKPCLKGRDLSGSWTEEQGRQRHLQLSVAVPELSSSPLGLFFEFTSLSTPVWL